MSGLIDDDLISTVDMHGNGKDKERLREGVNFESRARDFSLIDRQTATLYEDFTRIGTRGSTFLHILFVVIIDWFEFKHY